MTVAVIETSKKEVRKAVNRYLRGIDGRVLVLSYDTFRLHVNLFTQESDSKLSVCDLLICDEAHRLKNGESLIAKALDTLPCKRRILLSWKSCSEGD